MGAQVDATVAALDQKVTKHNAVVQQQLAAQQQALSETRELVQELKALIVGSISASTLPVSENCRAGNGVAKQRNPVSRAPERPVLSSLDAEILGRNAVNLFNGSNKATPRHAALQWPHAECTGGQFPQPGAQGPGYTAPTPGSVTVQLTGDEAQPFACQSSAGPVAEGVPSARQKQGKSKKRAPPLLPSRTRLPLGMQASVPAAVSASAMPGRAVQPDLWPGCLPDTLSCVFHKPTGCLADTLACVFHKPSVLQSRTSCVGEFSPQPRCYDACMLPAASRHLMIRSIRGDRGLSCRRAT